MDDDRRGEVSRFGDDPGRPDLAALMDRLRSALEGQYTIHGPLGEGGMALVFLAHDLKHDRAVALKVLKPGQESVRGSERFLREIGIAAKLAHPHILPLYDSGEADGLLYLVMPLVEEESLRDRLEREGALPLDVAVRLTKEIAGALHYAHERGLVHRDIKPENILLPSGHVAVADFGIARSLSDVQDSRLTHTGTSMGTVSYMSPEQASGGEAIDRRTDVYALGCVLYEMLQGTPPFGGRNLRAVLTAKLVGDPPTLAPDRDLPDTVRAVVLRALAPDPDDRYATTEALWQDLEQAVTEDAIEGAAVRKRRRRAVRGLTAAGALALLALAVAWGATLVGGPQIRRIAVLPLENESGDTTQTFFLDGMHEALISELQQAGMEVIGPRSVMQYRQDDLTPVREIASELNVDAVVEGTVRVGPDSVGLRLMLVDGETEAALWSRELGTPTSGVLRLYRDATAALADGIAFPLQAEARARLASAPPVDPRAYEAYLQGRAHWNRLAPEDLDLARQFFERALSISPDYALGHAGMALLWGGLQQMGLVSPAEGMPLQREAVDRALAADSTVAEAHLALGSLRVFGDWDWANGEESFLRALEINPSYADARAFYSHLLLHLGRYEEAIEQAGLAVEIEPVSPLIGSLECVVLGLAGQADVAFRRCRDVLDRDPRNIVAMDGLSNALAGLGRWDDFIANEIMRARELGIDWLAEVMAATHEPGGITHTASATADTLLAREARGEFVSPVEIARFLAHGDRIEESVDWLTRAVEIRDPALPYQIHAPAPEALRTHPRFRAVREATGLPPPP